MPSGRINLAKYFKRESMQMRIPVFFLISVMPSILFAQTYHQCKVMTPPMVVEGCQGEGCTIANGFTKVLRSVPVHAEMNLDSAVVDTLRKCEPFTDYKHLMRINSFGLSVVKNPDKWDVLQGFHQGDTLDVIKYESEGYFYVCAGNKNFTSDTYLVVRYPKVEEWVKLTTPRGVTGYSAYDIEAFVAYADGGRETDCPEVEVR